jgi:hypothetical protein
MTKTVERWRPIPGWEKSYELSSRGRLRSIPRLARTRGDGRRQVGGMTWEPQTRITLRASADWVLLAAPGRKPRECAPLPGGRRTYRTADLMAEVFPDASDPISYIDAVPEPPPLDEQSWRWVVDWAGEYRVSDWGAVKNCEKGRVLGQWTSGEGYCFVKLRGAGRRLVHRLVLEAFRGPEPEEGMVCRHLNGIRTDNRLVNLRWGSQRENAEDRWLHRLEPEHRPSISGVTWVSPDEIKLNWD